MAQMLKGGVIMDVVDVAQAKIAEQAGVLSLAPRALHTFRSRTIRTHAAGACAIMALERVPADIRKDGGVARMSDPKMIKVPRPASDIGLVTRHGHCALRRTPHTRHMHAR